MEMSLTRLQTEKQTAVEMVLEGSAGMPDAPLIRKTLKGFVRKGYSTVLVNLRRTRGLDRSCLDSLVSAARELQRRGGHLILRHCSADTYAEIQARHWDRCMLVPDHCPADAASMATSLGGDASDALDCADGSLGSASDAPVRRERGPRQ